MEERLVKIKKLQGQQNTVEDEVFKDFCRSIGVQNIRSVAAEKDRQYRLYAKILGEYSAFTFVLVNSCTIVLPYKSYCELEKY